MKGRGKRKEDLPEDLQDDGVREDARREEGEGKGGGKGGIWAFISCNCGSDIFLSENGITNDCNSTKE